MRLAPIMVPSRRARASTATTSSAATSTTSSSRRSASRAQEAQLRLYTDNIPDSVAYLDREPPHPLRQPPLRASSAAPRPDEIVGRTTAELMGPETAAWIAERTQKVFDRGEIATYEREIDAARRREALVPREGGAALRRARARCVGMYVVSHDISEVKQAQEQLAAREEELRFFAENIPEAIAYIDLERGCTFVNNVFLATPRLHARVRARQVPRRRLPARGDGGAAAAPRRAPCAARRCSYERLLARCPRARSAGCACASRRAATPTARCVGYYVVSTDIHEIKAAQAEIEDKERQLRQVIDSIPTPMCYVDADARYRYVNDAFLDYIGPALPSEIVGRTVREVLGEERWAPARAASSTACAAARRSRSSAW